MARLNEAPQPAVESIDACGLLGSQAFSAECLHTLDSEASICSAKSRDC